MRPLRLVLVARRFWPLVGENENTLANLAAELASRNCRITVLTAGWNPRWPSTIVYRGFPVVRLPGAPRGGWSTMRFMRVLGEYLRRRSDEYDVVYVSGLKHEAYAAVRAVGRRRPVVLRAEDAGRRGDSLWQIDASCGRRIKKGCMRARLFIGRTPGICRELVAAGYPRDRIHYVPDGVPIPHRCDDQRKAAARETLAVANPSLRSPQSAPVVLFAGPLDEVQGAGDLLEAWETVVRRWPNAKLWFVGTGPFCAALAERTESRSLSGRVVLAGQFETVDEFLTASDLLVIPAREGSARSTLLEAMAAGLPIVATDLADHGQFVADGEHAVIVPRGDVPALADAIIRVLSNPKLSRKLGERARRRAVEQFSLARMADAHLQLLEEIVASREPSSLPANSTHDHRLP